jgi:bacillithiol system protein YtxJ
MGLFNKLFSSSSDTTEKKELPWISLSSMIQLEEIQRKSATKTQIIFKHSTRCGISRMVMNQFIKSYDFIESDFDLYYLDLLSYRDISNKIAETFQVYHQSPQLLIIKNGITIAHESHGNINALNLQQFI